MADEKETKKVEYVFEGNSENLQNATQKAIDAFNRLESKITRFSKTNKMTSGIKDIVNSMTKEIQKMSKSTLKIDTNPLTAQLSSAVASVRTITSSLRNTFDPMSAKMISFRNTAVYTFNQVSKLASTISYAFRRVSTSSDSGSDSINRQSNAAKNLSKNLNSLKKSTNSVKTSFDSASKSAHSLWENMRYMTLEGTNLGQIFRLFTGYKLGQVWAEAVQEAVHYTEVLNMFTVAMGDSMEAGNEFVSTMSELYGLDPTSIMSYTARFHQLATAIDAPTEAAKNMSIGLTQMVVDVASLFDMPLDQVAQNFTSGMQGMAMAVRKYGFDIRVATLEQTALSLGLELNIKETSEANRQGLRYITMMRQASNATGDFAKTIESPANQMRILKEQMSQLARAIGNLFIPVLQAVLPLINGFVMALRTIINFLASLAGITVPTFGGVTDAAEKMEAAANGAASGVAGIGDAAKKAAKDAKNLLAPFDELNILQEKQDATAGAGAGADTGIGSDLMDPAIAAAIEAMKRQFEEIEMKANKIRDAILDFLGFDYVDYFNPDTGKWEKKLQWFADKFRENLIEKFPQWKQTINAIFDNWPELIDSFKRLGTAVYNVLVAGITPIIDFIKNLFGKVDWDALFASVIEAIPGWINSLAGWIEDNADSLSDLVTAIMMVGIAWGTWTGVLSPIIGEILAFVDSVGAAIAALNPVTTAFYAVIGLFTLSYIQFQSVRDAVKDLSDTFVMLGEIVGGTLLSMWDNIAKPVFKNLADNIQELYQKHLANAIEQFGLFVVALVDFLATMLTAISGVVLFLSETFGPTFAAVFNAVADLLTTVIGIIIDLLAALLQTLTGVLKFITGIFTADWKKAWSGIQDIFKGVWSAIVAIARGSINIIIDLINGVVDAIWSSLAAVINGIADVINSAAEVVDIELNLGVPSHPPSIPHLATGAVARKPTIAMIGEGSYDEAVIPLGESPQLAELVDKIAKAVSDEGGGTSGGGATFDITLELDGDVIYRNQQKVAATKGRQFNLGGFAR